MALDPNLRQFATEKQWAYLEAAAATSLRKAADRFGVHQKAISAAKKAVLEKAARAGYAPEHDQRHAAPDGFRSRGVSTLYRLDPETGEEIGPVLQWHKTAIDHDRQREMLEECADALAETLPRAKPLPPPRETMADLAVVYPVGDQHHGMFSWHEETGANWDVKISERVLTGAMQHLIGAAPPADLGLVVILGDFFHFQGFEAVTPKNRNLLDADSRFPKVAASGIRLARQTIEIARQRHRHVRVIVVRGNHDEAMGIVLAICLAAIYENEPRVEVDTSPANIHYHRFGKCLFAATHGDKLKMQRLPILMATDRPDDWGQSRHRYAFTGHVHHDQRKDFDGVIVESFAVLAANDAHAQTHGYRSRRGMHAIVYHREFGEVARHMVTPEMLEGMAE